MLVHLTMQCSLYKLIKSLEETPYWDVNRTSASQEIGKETDIHYHVHNRPPIVPIPSQINPVHVLPSYSSKINFNIILPSTSRFCKWSLSFGLSQQTPACISHPPHTCHMPRRSHLIFRVMQAHLLIQFQVPPISLTSEDEKNLWHSKRVCLIHLT